MHATHSPTNWFLLGALLLSATACGGAQKQATENPQPEPVVEQGEQTPAAPAVVRAPEPADLEDMTADLGDGLLRARLHTSQGTISCVLFEEAAPQTVANFVGLARGMRPWIDPDSDDVTERPLYEQVPFHRVIPDFAIQTGDPTGTGNGGPGYTFADEFSPDHRHSKPGILSMANHGPNTNGSQFFITERAVAHLDFRHTVFGACSDLDVIRKIARTPTGPEDRPVEAPMLERVEIFRAP